MCLGIFKLYFFTKISREPRFPYDPSWCIVYNTVLISFKNNEIKNSITFLPPGGVVGEPGFPTLVECVSVIVLDTLDAVTILTRRHISIQKVRKCSLIIWYFCARIGKKCAIRLVQIKIICQTAK